MSWVGYATGVSTRNLPPLKPGILQPYNVLKGYEPSAEVKQKLNTAYAEHYAPMTDISLLIKNHLYLGGM